MSSNRLRPSPRKADYVHLRTLATQLAVQLRTRLGGRQSLSIVDVGCGDRPYEPLLRPFSSECVGVDVSPGPGVDVVGTAESLPFDDERFDCLISTQVLQYTGSPRRAVAEAWRVLKPGGIAFLSTHGVASFDAELVDYWRWTHAGLEKLMRASADWASVDVYPNGGTGSAIAYLIGGQLEAIAHKARVPGLTTPLAFMTNLIGWNVDRLYRRTYPERPPDLASSYLVVGEK